MKIYKHFTLNSMLRYITVILFLVSTTVKAELAPKYDDPVNKLKFFDVADRSMTLTCVPSTPTTSPMKWMRNDTEVVFDERFKGRAIASGNTLTINKIDVADDGIYTCSIPETKESASINVIANVYLKNLPNNINVVEGEKLKIHCKAFGTDPIITWSLGDENGNPREINMTHITLEDEDQVKDAVLVIEHTIRDEDRGFYNCTARNKATGFKATYKEAEESTYVRVKGKLAALWPFLGICAEVLILCAIILVYEKRRNKEGLDESDTDQSPEQEKLKTGK